MNRLLLKLEGHCDIADTTTRDVEDAVTQMASATGPTYISIEGPDGYIQAAGSGDRYVVESRDVFGEGFLHWRAATPGPHGGKTTVLYRKKCPKGEHPPRGCPITVASSQVHSLADVLLILVQFAATQERHGAWEWQDVTVEFPPPEDIHHQIRDIRPHDRDATA
jgi:hypothetical protein